MDCLMAPSTVKCPGGATVGGCGECSCSPITVGTWLGCQPGGLYSRPTQV